jgi:hypothetical protein
MADGPRHLKLLHGNVVDLPQDERARFGRALADDARTIPDAELDRLLHGDWRSQLTAAWLAAIDLRTRHRPRIGKLLLASKLAYAGQGFCLALARFGTREDAGILGDYLDSYLPRPELHYDQHWAVGALLHLRVPLGERTGAWQEWVAAQPNLAPDPEEHRRFLDRLCAFTAEAAEAAETAEAAAAAEAARSAAMRQRDS